MAKPRNQAQTMKADICRAKICEYVSKNSGVTSQNIADHMGLNLPQLQYYLRVLIEVGYLQRVGDKKNATYTLGSIKYESNNYKSTPAHITVYRLLDKKQPPREKKRSSHPFGGMQSGITGFNSW